MNTYYADLAACSAGANVNSREHSGRKPIDVLNLKASEETRSECGNLECRIYGLNYPFDFPPASIAKSET